MTDLQKGVLIGSGSTVGVGVLIALGMRIFGGKKTEAAAAVVPAVAIATPEIKIESKPATAAVK